MIFVYVSKVLVKGARVTRDALVRNVDVLQEIINALGTRVSVDVIQLHLQSLYDFMQLQIPSNSYHV